MHQHWFHREAFLRWTVTKIHFGEANPKSFVQPLPEPSIEKWCHVLWVDKNYDENTKNST